MKGGGFVAAVQFLTRVPVRTAQASDMARAVTWFPVVGALIGAAVGGVAVGLGELVPMPVAAAVAVLFGVLVTGAFHEDGLADSADAFGAGGGTLVTGDIEVCRDMLLVEDVAWALAELAANPAASGVVNLCTGVPTRIGDLLEGMILASGKPITIAHDPARLRRGERRVIVGSPDALAALGAKPPRRDLRQAAGTMLTAPLRAA